MMLNCHTELVEVSIQHLLERKDPETSSGLRYNIRDIRCFGWKDFSLVCYLKPQAGAVPKLRKIQHEFGVFVQFQFNGSTKLLIIYNLDWSKKYPFQILKSLKKKLFHDSF